MHRWIYKEIFSCWKSELSLRKRAIFKPVFLNTGHGFHPYFYVANNIEENEIFFWSPQNARTIFFLSIGCLEIFVQNGPKIDLSFFLFWRCFGRQFRTIWRYLLGRHEKWLIFFKNYKNISLQTHQRHLSLKTPNEILTRLLHRKKIHSFIKLLFPRKYFLNFPLDPP